MKEFQRLFELFQYQLTFSRGGVFSLRMAALGPIIIVEPHHYVTGDVQRAIAEEFERPVYRSRLVNLLWRLLPTT